MILERMDVINVILSVKNNVRNVLKGIAKNATLQVGNQIGITVFQFVEIILWQEMKSVMMEILYHMMDVSNVNINVNPNALIANQEFVMHVKFKDGI